jgi:hypothetical protein
LRAIIAAGRRGSNGLRKKGKVENRKLKVDFVVTGAALVITKQCPVT